MIKLSVLYSNIEDKRFDLDYYLKKHMPLSINKFGDALKAVSVDYGINGGMPETKPPYIAAAHFVFDSVGAFVEAFTPHAEILQGDIKNYTDIEPLYQISEVKIYKANLEIV
jgi:uncharacterized protein (TIGR02118 family)